MTLYYIWLGSFIYRNSDYAMLASLLCRHRSVGRTNSMALRASGASYLEEHEGNTRTSARSLAVSHNTEGVVRGQSTTAGQLLR